MTLSSHKFFHRFITKIDYSINTAKKMSSDSANKYIIDVIESERYAYEDEFMVRTVQPGIVQIILGYTA